MREILVCENCKRTWTGDKDVNKYCSVCYGLLRPLNISDSLWERMSDNEKQEILNRNENRINTKIKLEIINGIYAKKEAYFETKQKNFVLILDNSYNTSTNKVETTEIKKNIDEILEYSCYEIEKDKSKNISIIVGVVTWFGSGFYNYYQTLDMFSFIEAIVTGIFWAFITWVISKQFKEKKSVIEIKFIDLEIIVEYVQDIYRLLDNKVRKSENSNNYYSFSKDDKYEQLIKLKELLDRNIITENEFNVEKKKILNN
jgi:predicted Fe-S protein YdhL (DUF1289 family)